MNAKTIFNRSIISDYNGNDYNENDYNGNDGK